MRAVVQRVTEASVRVGDRIVGSIGPGLCVLVGMSSTDTEKDMDYIIRKILGVKYFDDPETGKMWKRSVQTAGFEVLCVSQFTLHALVKKGNNPDFHRAMGSSTSKSMYEQFLQKMRTTYAPDKIQDGEFGAMMQVSLVNDGPVTIILDSQEGSGGKGEGQGKALPVDI